MARKKTDILLEDITIEAVAAEGKAIAHTPDSQVVFVPFAVPGDVVDIRVYKKKKNYLEGVIAALKKPSPDRLEPFCSHFGICGGCRWHCARHDRHTHSEQRRADKRCETWIPA